MKFLRGKCRRCKLRRTVYSRGLCSNCYYHSGQREQFPLDPKVKAKGANRGLGIGYGAEDEEKGKEPYSPPLPPEPTDALPGTEEKIEVMRERARLGFQLHHPRDATIEDVRADLLRMGKVGRY
jgi:hypothetical protein